MKFVFEPPQRSWLIQKAPLNSTIVLCLFMIACSDNNQDDPGPDPALGPKPVLWNLGVDFDANFTLDGMGKQHLKFFEFGFELTGHNGEIKQLPTFSYVMPNTTEIISPMKGYVSNIHAEVFTWNDNKDSLWTCAIHLKPHGDTTLWIVELSHLSKPLVGKGDNVDIGDLLGYPSQTGFELMVIAPQAAVCPWQVFAPEVLEETQKKLAKFMLAWDSAKWALPKNNRYHPENTTGVYWTNPTKEWDLPGCLVQEIR